MGDALDGLMAGNFFSANKYGGNNNNQRAAGGAYPASGANNNNAVGIFARGGNGRGPSRERLGSRESLVPGGAYGQPPRNPMMAASSMGLNIGPSGFGGAACGGGPSAGGGLARKNVNMGIANALQPGLNMGYGARSITPVLGNGGPSAGGPMPYGRPPSNKAGGGNGGCGYAGVANGGGGAAAAAAGGTSAASASKAAADGAAGTTNPPLLHGYACDQNSTWRRYMEDMYTTVADFAGKSGSLYAGVYDGHGGRTAVEFVQSHLHTQLEREVRGNPSMSIEEAMRNAFAKIDKMLSTMGAMNCGTTVAVCLCLRATTSPTSPVIIHMANAGDSRVVLVCDDGTPAKRLSVDHVATDPAEVQRVLSVGGTVMNNRVGGSLAVTRALGDHCLKGDAGVTCDPYYTQHMVGPHDKFIIMASDGIWDVVSDSDASDLANQHATKSPDEISSHFIQTALRRGSRDNLSCLVVKIR